MFVCSAELVAEQLERLSEDERLLVSFPRQKKNQRFITKFHLVV
jgi:hypothetical protein